VKEKRLGFFESFGWRFVSSESLPISEPVDKVIEKTTALYQTQKGKSSSSVEVRDPFGEWQRMTDEEIKEYIGDHLRRTFNYTNNSPDSGKGISGINVNFYKGMTRSYNWLMDLAIEESTALGGGARYFQRGEGWSMLQKPGLKFKTSHLLIRQRKQSP